MSEKPSKQKISVRRKQQPTKINIVRKCNIVSDQYRIHDYNLLVIPPPLKPLQIQSLLKSHYLGPARLVIMSLRHHQTLYAKDKSQTFPIKIETINSSSWSIYCPSKNSYVLVPKQFVIDEITLTTWKCIMQFYESVKNTDKDFDDTLSKYAKERMTSFVQEYHEFIQTGQNNNAWHELQFQIESAILEFFFPDKEDSDIFR